jgi:hypothetical protein
MFMPRVSVRGDPWWWWWCRLGITPDLSTRARWQSYQQRHVERVGEIDEGMIILHIQYLRYINEYFTCCNILLHGTSGFTSHPKEGVLRIFIALKNTSRRPRLNPRPLDPVASILTTTPPRDFLNTWYNFVFTPEFWIYILLIRVTVNKGAFTPCRHKKKTLYRRKYMPLK